MKKHIISTCYSIYKSRVTERGSKIFYLVGYIFDGIVIFIAGIILGIIIKNDLIPFDVVFQTWLLIIFLFRFTYNESQPFNITPFLSLPIPNFLIAEFYLKKELYSAWIFLMYPFLLPITFINHLFVGSYLECSYLVILIYLIALTSNLISNIIRILVDHKRTFYSLVIGLLLLLFIILSIEHEFMVIPILTILMDHPIVSIITVICFCLILWTTIKNIFKRRIYRIHDNLFYKSEWIFNSTHFLSKNFCIQLHFKELIRCKGFHGQLLTMLVLFLTGIIFFTIIDLKHIGLWFIIGSYPFTMIEYSIVKDSSYFDSIHTKPIKLQSILLSDYAISILITSFCFLFALICVFLTDISNLLSAATIYFFTIGPSTFLLFQVAVYSNIRFDPFEKIPGNSRMGMSYMQKILRVIAGIVSFVPVFIIIFWPALVSYILIAISLIIIAMHPIWLQNVSDRFNIRKYSAMEKFRV